jgi:hypothetical protein
MDFCEHPLRLAPGTIEVWCAWMLPLFKSDMPAVDEVFDLSWQKVRQLEV